MMRQLFEYHPIIAYHFIPGLKARIQHESGGYLVRVNQMGFRCDHEFIKEKEANKRRILLFGDSYTAGDGVSNGKRYGDLLEKEIPNLEVYNFALPGTGTDQHYLIYNEYAKNIEHDLVIIAILVENIRRIVAHYRPYFNEHNERIYFAKPYYELENGKLVLKQVPPPKKPVPESEIPEEHRDAVDKGGRFSPVRKFVKQLGLRDFAQKVTRYQPVPKYNSSENPVWKLMRTILEEWINNHPGQVLLMPIPLYHYVEELSDPSHYQARFREIAADTGCVLHDPLPDLLKYSLEQRRAFRFEKDIHPTIEGHKALSASLIPVVRNILENQK